MKIKIILILLLTACFTSIKAQSIQKTANDTIAVYISKFAVENNISTTPLLVIDGFAIDYSEYQSNNNVLSRSNISQIVCLSSENDGATNFYGERGKGGVLLITTNSSQEKSSKSLDDSKILFLLGDQQISQQDLDKISADDVESIQVFKDEKTIKKYTKDDYEGVVIINLKKGKKKKSKKKV